MSPTTLPDPEQRPEITDAPATAFVIGLFAGILSALLGIGGGLVMVPALAYLLRVQQHRAAGTALAVMLPTAFAAVVQYRIGHWAPVAYLSIGCVIGALVGARLAAALKARKPRRLFGAVVAVTGILMVLPVQTDPSGVAETAGTQPLAPGLLVAAGMLVGALAGLLGVGGGLVMVPVLALGLGLSQKLAQGISLAVVIPVSLSGAAMHVRRGNVIPGLAVWLSLGAVPGAMVTGHWVQGVEDRRLRLLFGLFLTIVGLGMAISRAATASRPPERGEE